MSNEEQEEPAQPPDDKLLTEEEQERVTVWRVLRRVYLRVACDQTGQRIDDLTVQEQETLLERWRGALTHDWTQLCEVLSRAAARGEMNVIDKIKDDAQREALMQVLHERPEG